MNEKYPVVIYVRNSTEQQKADGTIHTQIKSIQDYCNQKEWDIINTFMDEAVSGSTDFDGRRGFQNMIEFVKNNGNIKAVVIYKLDRLARDLIIQEKLLAELQVVYKLNIHSVNDPEDLFSNDPIRILLRQILGALSQYEKYMIFLRNSNGLKRKWEEGKVTNNVPYGYMKDAENNPLIDPVRAPWVQQVFRWSDEGWNLEKISTALTVCQAPKPLRSKVLRERYFGDDKRDAYQVLKRRTLYENGILTNGKLGQMQMDSLIISADRTRKRIIIRRS
jgi:DNA invertase Pin-like site-specific DNA recombinase